MLDVMICQNIHHRYVRPRHQGDESHYNDDNVFGNSQSVHTLVSADKFAYSPPILLRPTVQVWVVVKIAFCVPSVGIIVVTAIPERDQVYDSWTKQAQDWKEHGSDERDEWCQVGYQGSYKNCNKKNWHTDIFNTVWRKPCLKYIRLSQLVQFVIKFQ